MTSNQDLANQLGWSITTKDYLNELNSELRYVNNSYANLAQDLSAQDYLGELLAQIAQMQNEFSQNTDELIRHVENEHLEYIQRQADSIKEKLASL